ncbi:MAG TPA: YqaA family protein, partial [Gammaproteobacteria bacterium]|nr:YqaA family protein [Gammaproteobacteria bacterium]
MRLFTPLYDKCMTWARHRYASGYLVGLSFAESSFFPIPPDVMLAPMSMAQPARAMRFAALTTVASVIGGLFGYLIGYYFFELIQPWLQTSAYWDKYLHARQWFEAWGFWAMLVAGFSPIPYKVFTIAAGTLAMNLPLFIAGSLLGRGGRFF